MFRSSVIGVDLGTTTTRLWVRDASSFIQQPSIVAKNKLSGSIEAIGNKAKEMIGRSSANIILSKPIKEGAVYDFELAATLIQHKLAQASPNKFHLRPNIVIATPIGISLKPFC